MNGAAANNKSKLLKIFLKVRQPANLPRPLAHHFLGPNCRVDFSATNEAVNYKFTTVHFGHRLSLKIWSLNCVYWIDIS